MGGSGLTGLDFGQMMWRQIPLSWRVAMVAAASTIGLAAFLVLFLFRKRKSEDTVTTGR